MVGKGCESERRAWWEKKERRKEKNPILAAYIHRSQVNEGKTPTNPIDHPEPQRKKISVSGEKNRRVHGRIKFQVTIDFCDPMKWLVSKILMCSKRLSCITFTIS